MGDCLIFGKIAGQNAAHPKDDIAEVNVPSPKHEKQFKNLTELEDAIRDYIEYYNQKRIKIKLKGLTPLEYRQLVLS